MASTYLTRTNGSAVTAERRTFTISFWVKRCSTGTEHALCSAGNGGGSEEFAIRIRNDDTIEVWHYDGSSFVGRKRTNRVLRDTNAWYHIFCQYDTTESTADDRIKFYINGVRETSFADSVNPTLNDNTPWNVDERHQIGSNSWNNSGNGAEHLNGCISYFYNVAGSIINVSQFGSTDSTTGEWKINTSPTISSYGTNGFLVLKDGNTVTDQSPNSNNFTVGGGTLTKSEDNPSNVFCTLNALTGRASPTLSLGNLKTTGSSDGQYVFGTIGSKAGYYEVKIGQNPDAQNGNGLTFGCFDSNYAETTNSTSVRSFRTGHGYTVNYSVENMGGGTSYEGTSTGVSASVGDIVSVAWKNGKLYVAKNGTYFFSANPSNNTDGSTQVPLADSTAYQLPVSRAHVDGMNNSEWNFGNGFFGTTAITTNNGNGYQDANGQGKFNYQPPTGCYALCTKNLNV